MPSDRTTLEVLAPHATPATAPVLSRYPLPGPRLRHVDVRIPDGHKGLAWCQVVVPGYGVVIPGTFSSLLFVHGNNEVQPYDFDIRLEAPRNQIEVRVYNLDALLDHTFILDIYTELMR